MDNGGRNSDGDSFNISDMMNLDGYTGWYGSSPMSSERMLASYGISTFQSMTTHVSGDQLNLLEQNFLFPMAENIALPGSIGTPLNYVDKSIASTDFSNSSDSNVKQNSFPLVQHSKVPRPLGKTFPERMLWALSLLKESSNGGTLAQVWAPVRNGDKCVLSTCEQPFLLDQVLAGYREVSRSYTFSVEQTPGSFPGLPGRVFISKVPEWTSNVNYYSMSEYLRVEQAARHEVRGSVALPVFSSSDTSCCAVLELVTTKAKPDFDLEIDNVCRALQAVNLRTSGRSQLEPQSLSVNHRSALTEITDVLRAVCHAHGLPLALIWIPCTLKAGHDDEVIVYARETHHRSGRLKLCVLENACYVNDRELKGFVHACARHPLEEGQGVAGKALMSNIPFFFPDVKKYHINEYPLVHHARKFGLNAAVAIRLRSLHTGTDDYILEFFLPSNMTGDKKQQLLLDNLSSTMQRICRSLRMISDEELACTEGSRSYEGSLRTSHIQSELHKVDQMPFDVSNIKDGPCEAERSDAQEAVRSRRLMEKKRSTAEKAVSLSVLQNYFAGSLKDAAKSIGVCPTTLKKICRQHGISRWPSRKINKVNRSLRKIQTVLESVQGVERGLKFDPTTCEIVARSSISPEIGSPNSPIVSQKTQSVTSNDSTKPDDMVGSVSIEGEICSVKIEEDENKCLYGNQRRSEFYKQEPKKFDKISAMNRVEGDNEIAEHQLPTFSGITETSNVSKSMSRAPNINEKFQMTKESVGDTRSRTIVKVTYKEDTVRFKFNPSAGYLCLYEEVAMRFKLQPMTFQLKYLDDEEEWVLLQSEQDLQECLEIAKFAGKQSIKILARDFANAIGSSGSSCSFLTGS